MPLEAARGVSELPPHPLHLLQDDACMMQQRLPRRCRPGPAASPLQQRNAERLLHAANAGARRGEGHVRPVGAMRDAAGFGDMQEQAQIRQIEAHRRLGSWAVQPSFQPKADSGTSTLPRAVDRSEEHTSELQSLMRISYAVFCLNKK